ncbi:hypothetical protein GNF72_14795, partial [Clostridium perfringens]|uniref:hypothetical protein n=1 Tax=Clostridium perfringens TaxID=1502 RepID=UPI002AC6C6AA
MNEDIIESANEELIILHNSVPKGKHIKTGDIRKLSAKLYKIIPDKSINEVLKICETLLEQHSWALRVIAFDWANRVHKQYT